MTDRLIKVLENGRFVARGVGRHNNGVVINLTEDESLPYTVDWSGWLGSDTISSVTNESHGPTVSNASNTTTTASLTITASSNGYIQHRVTTAAGATKELMIVVNGEAGRKGYPRFV